MIFGDLYGDYVSEYRGKRIFNKCSEVGLWCDTNKICNRMLRLSLKHQHKLRLCTVFGSLSIKIQKKKSFIIYIFIYPQIVLKWCFLGSYVSENNSLVFGHVGLLTFYAIIMWFSCILVEFYYFHGFYFWSPEFLEQWVLTAVLLPDVLSTKFKTSDRVVFPELKFWICSQNFTFTINGIFKWIFSLIFSHSF